MTNTEPTTTNGLGAIGVLKHGKIYRTPMEKIRIVQTVFAVSSYEKRKEVAAAQGVHVSQVYAWYKRMQMRVHAKAVRRTVKARPALPALKARDTSVAKALADLEAAIRADERRHILSALIDK